MATKGMALALAVLMVERSTLSVFDAGQLETELHHLFPLAERDEIWRAIRIFLELRRADDNFARYGGTCVLSFP